ncbi:MAG: hypothetical protein AAF828_04715 [Bacteroidota bacterium]
MKNSFNTLFTTLLLLCCFYGLSAQSTHDLHTERQGIQRTKKQLMKQMDLFGKQKFVPFFYGEFNYGLNATFSKDKVFTRSAPLSLGLGYRFSPKFSAGLRAGQSVYSSEINYYDISYKTKVETRFQMVSAVANAHVGVGVRGEFFGGIGIGYQNTELTAMEESDQPKDTDRKVVRPQQGLLLTAQVGGRYSLSPALSIQGEMSTGLSTLSIGLRYRLR